jgi:DNA phosphorothioation-associated putative methyltransferase
MDEPPSQIERHKTAIRRKDFSLAVKCLLRDGLLGPGRTFFDYGCGRGEDIDLLAAQGVTASGWDPAFRPDAPRTPAEIVNLGYVLNVIEDPQERAAVLASAWGLATRLLAVAARVNVERRGYSPRENLPKKQWGSRRSTHHARFNAYLQIRKQPAQRAPS